MHNIFSLTSKELTAQIHARFKTAKDYHPRYHPLKNIRDLD